MEIDADQIIFEAACQSLPNSSPSRSRQILEALRVKIRRGHPARENVCAQLAMLDTLDKLQTELHLSFKTGGAK